MFPPPLQEMAPELDPKAGCLASPNLRSLWGFFALNTVFAAAQMTAAVVNNSLSMISDSGSMLVDSLTYAVNIYAERRRLRSGADAVRLEVYASLFSVAALIVVTTVMFIDATHRLCCGAADEKEVDGKIVLGFASGNLAIDVLMCTNLFYQQSKHGMDANYARKNINMASAIVHVVADTLRTVTGMAAGAIELNPNVDPIVVDAYAAIAVCVFILIGAGFVLWEALTQLRSLNAASNRMDLLDNAQALSI
jgi:Co/Zn/Cd efflux system component